jgi:predicted nuclease of restriction endonuclease-like (RecB) superfamily
MDRDDPPLSDLSFDRLVAAIEHVHVEMAARASRAVNRGLTLRNWFIGCYIAEYEQRGADRARYGEGLLEQLAARLVRAGVARAEARELRRYRQFYVAYPRIWDSLPPKLKTKLFPTAAGAPMTIRESLTPESGVPAADLLARLSFTHIAELLKCEDAAARAFYEGACLRGAWSVRELKRQMGSLYYERSRLSTDSAGLSALASRGPESAAPVLSIRDPYVFEFLGLKPAEVMTESHLEAQLLDKLRDFLLELGDGFCFEASQKRILIGDSHNFVDLVFYHRVLKCHVLVELKLAAFSHENIGQLNTYVTWYRTHMMTDGDQAPVGILLCTQKDHALVEYALAGLDNGLFVSKYLLELPRKEAMQGFIEEQLSGSAWPASSA